MSHGAPGSVVKSGFKPRRQVGRPDFKPGDRTVTYSFIAEMIPEDLRGLRVAADDAKNVGDDSCWGVWKADTRETSSLSVHFPAVVAAAGAPKGTTQPAMLPIFARDMPDDRYETKRPKPGVTLPHGAQRFHTGQTGSVTAAMSEEEQIDIFGADWMGLLLSAGPGEDLTLSTMLYGVGKNGGPHSTRYAPFHRFAAPIDTPWGTGVGLNLTTGPAGDATTTALPLIDHASNAIGLGSFLFGGGPLIVASDAASRPCGKHVHGFDDIGRGIHAAHIAAGINSGALYLDTNGRDACLKFDSQGWIPQGSTTDAAAAFGHPGFEGDKGYLGGDGPISSSGPSVALWTETFLRYDPADFHFYQKPDGTWKQAPGKWKWQTPVPLVMLSAPGGEYSNPEPFEGTRTRGGGSSTTSSSGGSGSSSGSGSGGGGNPTPRRPRKPTAEDYQAAERERQRKRRRGGGGDPNKMPPPGQPPQWPHVPQPTPKGGGKPGKGGGGPRNPDDPEGDAAEDEANRIIEETSGDGGEDRIEFYDGAGGRGSLDEDGGNEPFGVGDAAEDALGNPDLLPGVSELGPGIGLGTGFGIGGGLEEGTTTTAGPTGTTGSAPELAFAPNCIQVPNLGFVAYPTSGTSVAIGGGGVPGDQLLEEMKKAPLAAYTQAIGIGEGGSGEQTTVANGDGWNHSPESSVSMLPSWVDFRTYVGGEWDANRTGSSSDACVRYTIPGGLASMDFSHSIQSPDQVTTGGGRIAQAADGDGMHLNNLGTDGTLGSSAVEITAGGIELTGTLTNNGSPIGSASGNNAIGGDSSDGTISLSANTSYNAVVNAAGFTLASTYFVYSGAYNFPLVIKTTGVLVIAGTLTQAGRAQLDPA